MLMYHSVSEVREDPYRVTVTPHRLERQLRWLRRRGLRGVCVATLLAARAAGRGEGLVGLTFDDGYADFLSHAVPLLHRYGCTAT
ncbi:polysaccharide deacetylase family protein, partial [Streptomyces sp. SID11233]|nr:polysaccharide deacetylase family protein [Streptomyces sp. SID11233]